MTLYVVFYKDEIVTVARDEYEAQDTVYKSQWSDSVYGSGYRIVRYEESEEIQVRRL